MHVEKCRRTDKIITGTEQCITPTDKCMWTHSNDVPIRVKTRSKTKCQPLVMKK